MGFDGKVEHMTDAAVADRPGDAKGRTLIEAAYATLRSEIVDGTLEPGAKLRTEELRARYDVSGSTIREALTRLLGEALVTSEGQRGFRVATATLEDFRDLTEVRKLIETEALRQAIAAGGEAWEGDIGVMGDATPAADVAAMLILEMVLHGWDVARATGQEYTCEAAVAEAVLKTVQAQAELFRKYDGFKDATDIPDDAPALDRALALSGRDPQWKPIA